MPHLAVSHIAKSYDGNPAVRDISFEVAAGRVLALCGENGAGKSTLMKMLSGATRPDSGEILLDGKAVDDRRPVRCDGARHPHRLPGTLAAAASQRRREHAARAHADARAFLRGRLADGEPHRGARACRFRFPGDRSDGAGRLAQRRAPADRRDRQGAGRRTEDPDPRRADRGDLRRGSRQAVRQGAQPRGRGHDGPLHLAPARGNLRHRRRDRGAEGRPQRAVRRGRRTRPGTPDPRHGRPAAFGDLPGAQGRGRQAGARGREAARSATSSRMSASRCAPARSSACSAWSAAAAPRSPRRSSARRPPTAAQCG